MSNLLIVCSSYVIDDFEIDRRAGTGAQRCGIDDRDRPAAAVGKYLPRQLGRYPISLTT